MGTKFDRLGGSGKRQRHGPLQQKSMYNEITNSPSESSSTNNYYITNRCEQQGQKQILQRWSEEAPSTHRKQSSDEPNAQLAY